MPKHYTNILKEIFYLLSSSTTETQSLNKSSCNERVKASTNFPQMLSEIEWKISVYVGKHNLLELYYIYNCTALWRTK